MDKTELIGLLYEMDISKIYEVHIKYKPKVTSDEKIYFEIEVEEEGDK